MNRSGVRSKRSIGKVSPLTKRPKLDFSVTSRDGLNESKNSATSTHVKDTSVGSNQSGGKANGNVSSEPDWDDDFSGDMLEKVCLIADLSQAMVNNQTSTEKVEKTKVQLFKGSNASPTLESECTKNIIEINRLKLELQELKDKFKTKEGEVHILRSQLKQNEDTKQAAALQNIKVIDDIHKKYNDKISLTEKELENVKTKLQFKDMEYKTLSERCRQLEYCMSKNKMNDTQLSQAETVKHFVGFPQSLSQRPSVRDVQQNTNGPVENPNASLLLDTSSHHDGRYLEKCLCPEMFELIDEPSVIHFHAVRSGTKNNKTKINYKWTDLPKQNLYLKDLYEPLSGLFVHETFARRDVKTKVENILDRCVKIVTYNKDVLAFLDKLQLKNCEYDNSDQSLLENDDEAQILTIKCLLRGKRLSEEEYGIEGRRTLGLMYALMDTSRVAVDFVKSKNHFIDALKLMAVAIGNLRRPLRYKGILCGICFILQKLLLEKNLNQVTIRTINEIVEEIVFARPKLDVLTEIVNVLAAGRNHFEFLSGLCRKASIDSCSLYMDSRLKQAMFFTKNACPLKILCMQIMGLACRPSSRNIRWHLTESLIRWLNNSINSRENKKLKWLPTNSLLSDNERCFDVTECLLYMLTLCLKEYLAVPDAFEPTAHTQNGQRRSSIIGHGAILLKRILKSDHRQLNDNSYSLRFVALLNGLMLDRSDNVVKHRLNSVQIEAITWLTDSLETDLRNQEQYMRQNTSAISESDILSALKVNDKMRIY